MTWLDAQSCGQCGFQFLLHSVSDLGPVHQVIRTGLLELVDRNGRIRSRLGMGGSEEPFLALYDTAGRHTALLSCGQDGGHLLFLDRLAEIRVAVGVMDGNQAGLQLVNDNGTVTGAFTEFSDRTKTISLHDVLGGPRIILNTAGDGTPSISLYDASSTPRIGLSTRADGSTSIALYAVDGSARGSLTVGVDGNVVLGLGEHNQLQPTSLVPLEDRDSAGGTSASLRTSLTLQGSNGEPRAILSVDVNDCPVLSLLDNQGQPKVIFRVLPDGSTVVSLTDKEGGPHGGIG
jgi:hypothetical protein